MSRLALGLLLATTLLSAGCAADPVDEGGESSEDAIKAKADDEWFYVGPLPTLKDAKVTVSLAANTAHVVGFLPAGAAALPPLPHVKTRSENGRTRVDIVYPIATAAPPKTNSRPGTYSFVQAKPYRPDGNAFTVSAGNHFVTWGGFPFIEYNSGIAFHGPITSQDSKDGGQSVWYLRRGDVSSGCNRMLGENVVELAHVLGLSMRKLYGRNQSIPNPSSAKVTVIEDYDTLDGKFIDSDYATDVGVTRPGKEKGDANVVMFGSWVASEMPNGKDLPPDQKWEGGVNGKPYVFAEHALSGMVCSYAAGDLANLKKLAASFPNAELPRSICEKKACIVDALRAGKDAKATCGL
ncbi:hypothetical protein BH11MYX4_BH11MYX4_41010 [soil metagenome]